MKILKVLGLAAIVAFSACQSSGADAEKAAAKTEAAKPAAQKTKIDPGPSLPVSKRSPEQQMEADKKLIAKYVTDNGLKGQYTDSGIFYSIEKQGSGANPTKQNTVTCHYRGTLLTGKQFDSSYDRGQPASFPLTRVIPGWQEGIPLLKKGGKGKLIIPSGLAYGPVTRGADLPANSVLIFDVELVDFK